MRYQKPIVMDLDSQARLAAGGPLACISGPAAVDPGESCGTGDGAGWSCVGGSVVTPPGFPLCAGGSAAGDSGGDCFSGGTALYCEVGTAGSPDPFGCRTGPSFV